MPRILAPNSSFQRRGSLPSRTPMSWHAMPSSPINSRRSGIAKPLAVVPQQRPRRCSVGDDPSCVTQTKADHRWQNQNNVPPHNGASTPSTISSQSTYEQRSPPSSRFRVVNRHHPPPQVPAACRSSFIPIQNAKEEDAWGQFVDVADEEEKFIRLSRVLSRSRA